MKESEELVVLDEEDLVKLEIVDDTPEPEIDIPDGKDVLSTHMSSNGGEITINLKDGKIVVAAVERNQHGEVLGEVGRLLWQLKKLGTEKAEDEDKLAGKLSVATGKRMAIASALEVCKATGIKGITEDHIAGVHFQGEGLDTPPTCIQEEKQGPYVTVVLTTGQKFRFLKFELQAAKTSKGFAIPR